ncbi:hypothetical protein OsI_03304 [Oryza sativa Indica Group]|uniref:DNA ligase n=1 Tax=Oryza sativa subsp. indica TaxID=39946 RepID=B8A7M7_ORYSI|nr:hypothetical protein OsI_03304 [Oryza sativa Indica Group]
MGGASSLWMLTIAPVPFNSSSAHLDQMRRDTTYCNPKFTFPPQKESLEYVVNSIKRVKEESRASGERVLCLIATYVVGKERILLEVARRCGCKIHVDSRKMEILTLLGIGGEDGVFTEDAAATDVHVTGWNILGETWPYFRPNFVKMKEIMVERGYNKAVGFVPTGWMYETKKEGFAVRTKDSLEIHLVPYSEHSSYNELRDYVKFLHPKRVIPTVGLDGGKLDSKEAFALQKHFAGLVDETANKQEFLMAFQRSSRNATLGPEDAVTGLSQQEGEVQELEEATLLPASLAFERSDSFQEKITVEMKKELSDFLPSWVSQDLILDLLIKSAGDVVQAATDFFEKERDFFEEANVYNSETPKSEIDLSSDHGSSADASSQQEVPLFSQKPMDHSSKLLNLNAMRMKSNLSKRERKRGSNSADKPKKKGRSTSFKPLTESSGRKQSTITNYFARTMLAASKSDTSDKVTVDANQNNVRNDDQFTEVVESEKQSVSQLLQIVDGGMSRESAISLLEKAKGDVNVAVDIFYSKTDNSNVLENDMNIVTQNTENEMTDNLVVRACFATLLRPLQRCRTYVYNLMWHKQIQSVYHCQLKSIYRSSMEALGSSRSKIHEMYKTFGDLGDVAQECRQNQMLLAPPRPLSIRDVFSTLRKLSGIAGSGSTGRRKILVLHLIRSCREMEMKFLVRTLVRNLRIGVMMKTILPALAHAVVIDGKYSNSPVLSLEGIKPQLQELSTEVAEAYNVIPNLDLLIPSLLREGTAFSASSLAMITGTPIPPMLARITNGLTQSLKLFNGRAFTCEYKYDGQRAQIHRSNDGSVQIFSRQMKESTSRFPDLVGMIKELCSIEVSSFILDAEVVGIDRKKGNKLMSFQELSSRERGSKHSSIAIQNIKVDICVFVFDIMFCNGQSLLNCSLRQRRKYIHDLFQEKPGHFELAQQLTVEADEASVDNSTTLERMNTFFKMACQSSCEGIMLKILDVDAGYSASKRCDSWLKVKRDYVGLGDSLDLVPIGAWYGNGRKAGWYSPFLMACYNPEYEEFQSVCRVMSGFSDEFYKEPQPAATLADCRRCAQRPVAGGLPLLDCSACRCATSRSPMLSPVVTHQLDAGSTPPIARDGESMEMMKEFYSGDRILPKKPVYYKTDELPELWFSAEQVWEIRGADLTLSPVHHAAIGLVHPSRGISVRMPRYIRSRPDRSPEDCSTATDVASLFKAQTRKMEVSSDGQDTSH